MRWVIVILLLSACTAKKTVPTKTVATLKGRVVQGDISVIKWRSLGGATIDSPSSLHTQVTLSNVGAYSFELSGVDVNGMIAKDTVTVTVIKK